MRWSGGSRVARPEKSPVIPGEKKGLKKSYWLRTFPGHAHQTTRHRAALNIYLVRAERTKLNEEGIIKLQKLPSDVTVISCAPLYI